VDLQEEMENALLRGLEKVGASRGAAIALDPNSGEVLGLVSWPAYDSNSFTGPSEGLSYSELLNDENQPLFNRVVQGRYPSGSTIKPVIAAAALEEKLINENTVFFSSGGIDVGRWFFPDWKSGGHGWTDVKKALADSVNTFFYIIGGGYEEHSGLGIELIEKYAGKFGLASVTGIDLPGEASGLIPSPEWKESVKGEPWYIGDTYHAAIGQGDVLVTPLQVAQFTSVFANGGTLYQPHLILESELVHNGNRQRVVPAIYNDRIASPDTVDIVRQGMRQAVTEGSAIRLNSLPVTSAGKTGTAELGGTKKPHAWFTGFAPYENPEIVITVLLEEGDGSNNAMPVVYDILKWWAENRMGASDLEV
jgi:penicillin-binding protein 2